MIDDGMPGEEAAARGLNAAVAVAYDTVIHEVAFRQPLGVSALLGQAALYGALPQGGDVLDLGCGTGIYLQAAGKVMAGRLVGIDLSRKSIEIAAARCAGFGARADLRCADFLDLDPGELGQFDLIYHIGVHYVTPPLVRKRLLDLIGRCLKPGGTVVISYYAGLRPLIRRNLIQTLRAMDDPHAGVAERIAAIRRHIEELAALKSADDGTLTRATLNSVRASTDDILFHETLTHEFEVLDTMSLATSLASRGVRFLGYAQANMFDMLPTPLERARGAARMDYLGGSYRQAVFSRLPDGAAGVDLRSPAVRWRLLAARTGKTATGATYSDGVSSANATGSLANVMEALEQRPLGWRDMLAIVEANRRPGDLDDAGVLEDALKVIWPRRLVMPLRMTA